MKRDIGWVILGSYFISGAIFFTYWFLQLQESVSVAQW